MAEYLAGLLAGVFMGWWEVYGVQLKYEAEKRRAAVQARLADNSHKLTDEYRELLEVIANHTSTRDSIREEVFPNLTLKQKTTFLRTNGFASECWSGSGDGDLYAVVLCDRTSKGDKGDESEQLRQEFNASESGSNNDAVQSAYVPESTTVADESSSATSDGTR